MVVVVVVKKDLVRIVTDKVLMLMRICPSWKIMDALRLSGHCTPAMRVPPVPSTAQRCAQRVPDHIVDNDRRKAYPELDW